LVADLLHQLARRRRERRARLRPLDDRLAGELEPPRRLEQRRETDLDRLHRLLELRVVDDGDVLANDLDLRLLARRVHARVDFRRRLAIGRCLDVGVAVALARALAGARAVALAAATARRAGAVAGAVAVTRARHLDVGLDLRFALRDEARREIHFGVA